MGPLQSRHLRLKAGIVRLEKIKRYLINL